MFNQMPIIQISARDAFELLKNDQNSVLVDVRTFEEFNFVGFVNPASFNNRLVLLPWQLFPAMNENPEFANSLEESLKKLFGEEFQEMKIIFICRTGGRSNAAANHALNLGYKNCYNLIAGFEGELDKEERRGNVNGWKASDLPWRQK
jgi:rhodanese-related sulfurtransferase